MSTPRERRHEITKQRILDTARAILAADGLDGLSMRGLAQQIDYTPSAIYKYFASKEEILQAIRQEGFARGAVMQAEAIQPGMTPPEMLLAAGRAYLRFAELYPEHYQLMFNSPDLPPESIQAMLSTPDFNGLPQAIAAGVDQGYLHLPPGYTPELLAVQAWVMVHGIAMIKMNMMQAVQEDFGTLCDQMLQAFIASFTVS